MEGGVRVVTVRGSVTRCEAPAPGSAALQFTCHLGKLDTDDEAAAIAWSREAQALLGETRLLAYGVEAGVAWVERDGDLTPDLALATTALARGGAGVARLWRALAAELGARGDLPEVWRTADVLAFDGWRGGARFTVATRRETCGTFTRVTVDRGGERLFATVEPTAQVVSAAIDELVGELPPTGPYR
jgi:hypothetical protein